MVCFTMRVCFRCIKYRMKIQDWWLSKFYSDLYFWLGFVSPGKKLIWFLFFLVHLHCVYVSVTYIHGICFSKQNDFAFRTSASMYFPQEIMKERVWVTKCFKYFIWFTSVNQWNKFIGFLVHLEVLKWFIMIMSQLRLISLISRHRLAMYDRNICTISYNF
jgi:hypothetical protein